MYLLEVDFSEAEGLRCRKLLRQEECFSFIFCTESGVGGTITEPSCTSALFSLLYPEHGAVAVGLRLPRFGIWWRSGTRPCAESKDVEALLLRLLPTFESFALGNSVVDSGVKWVRSGVCFARSSTS